MANEPGKGWLKEVLEDARKETASWPAWMRGEQPAASEAERLRALLREALEALERGDAAVWDKHYGKGLSVEYARAVHAELAEMAAKIREALR